MYVAFILLLIQCIRHRPWAATAGSKNLRSNERKAWCVEAMNMTHLLYTASLAAWSGVRPRPMHVVLYS